MKLADRQLRDASIRAPFDGYVQKRMVSLGELVKSQMPVMSVVRVDPLKVTGRDSRAHGAVDQGRPAGRPAGRRVSGQDVHRQGVADQSGRQHARRGRSPFEALVPNADALLKPGTFARVHLDTALVEQVLTIPYAAMQYRYGVYRAFTVDGDRLTVHELKTGDRVGDRMEILGGVEAGRPGRADRRRQSRRRHEGRRQRRDGVAMLSELCVRRPVFATMLVMSLVVLGIFSFRDLGVDLFPQGRSGDRQRLAPAAGRVARRDDDRRSIMPMENALSGIAGIDQLRANVNAGGTASITVRFLLERDLDDAANNVREKVAGAMRNVPPEVLPPVIQKADPDADPIMSIVLVGEERRACAP